MVVLVFGGWDVADAGELPDGQVKSDLAARPIYHHTRDSIEAHLSIVFAALAVGALDRGHHRLVDPPVVKTARLYRTIAIQAGDHIVTAADPLPDDLASAIETIKHRASAH